LCAGTRSSHPILFQEFGGFGVEWFARADAAMAMTPSAPIPTKRIRFVLIAATLSYSYGTKIPGRTKSLLPGS